MKSSRTKPCRRSASKSSNKKGAADTGLSPSKRHREKLNNVMDELCELLPLSTEVKSNLDRLSVLKLTVSFFQTKNLTISADRARQYKQNSSKDEQARLAVEGLNLSELALQAIGGFFLVLTDDGVVYYVSENVQRYLGYSQTKLMHQEFFPHVHADDLQGLKSCFDNLKGLSDKSNTITTLGTHQQCFCNIRCHAGRLSSHVSPFYYKCFKFYGRLKSVKRKSRYGSTKYGFFALCSPVDRQAEVFRPLSNNVEKYTCKMDPAYKNLEVDARGLKFLVMGEKDLMGRSSYMFFHPEDLGAMALVHERLLQENKGSMTFRVLKGNGKWQWVRGSAYSIIKNGKVDGMISRNFFISDEEGEYFKEQDMKEIQEWKAHKLALPFSQTSPSYDSSSPSSTNLSPRNESFHSIPVRQTQHHQAMEANENMSRHYLQPHKPGTKSSCLVQDDPLQSNDILMDNNTMLKIITDLHNSLIDEANTRPYPSQPLPDLTSGPVTFSESTQEHSSAFVNQYSNIKTNSLATGLEQGNTVDLSSCHLDSNRFNMFNESVLFHNKPDNSCITDVMGPDEGSMLHMDESSLADFEPLPLREVESILSPDKSTYTMVAPLQPLVMPEINVQAYPQTSYSFNEQNPMVGSYGLTHRPVNMVANHGFTSTNKNENNGFTNYSELTHPQRHKYT